MKSGSLLRSGTLPILLTLLLTACNREPGTTERLGELEKQFPAASVNGSSKTAEGAAPQVAEAKSLVQKAVEAVKANQPADGIMMLQTAQKMPNLDANQRMSVQNSIRAITADLVKRASTGDTKAKEDLKKIEAFLGQN